MTKALRSLCTHGKVEHSVSWRISCEQSGSANLSCGRLRPEPLPNRSVPVEPYVLSSFTSKRLLVIYSIAATIRFRWVKTKFGSQKTISSKSTHKVAVMGESLLQGFPEAAPSKPTEELIYADVSSCLTVPIFLHHRIISPYQLDHHRE